MTDVYYLRIRGTVMGPFRPDQVRELLQRGKVGRLHEISTDRETWHPISQDQEFVGYFQSRDADATPAAKPQSADSAQLPTPPPQPPATPQQLWFYADHGTQVGPVDEATMASLVAAGRITPDTLVWTGGMATWFPLRSTSLERYCSLGAPLGPLHPSPPPARPDQITGHVWRKPEIPTVIKAGIWLYIASFLLTVIDAVASEIVAPNNQGPAPNLPDGGMAALLGACCLGVILAIVDIAATVLAACGYAAGAIIKLVLFVPGVVLWIFMMAVSVAGGLPPVTALSVLSFCVDIVSLVCFIVPGAWDYYAACKAFRRKRSHAAVD